MRKAILIAFAMLFVFAMAGTALAVDPVTFDTDTGSSMWTYQDRVDTAAKTEGSYKAFDDQTTKMYSNPHGGYDTTTNKCKVCHAVHRAEGAYFMLRADTQDDACDYCHIGGSAHSTNVVYDLNAAGKATPNGHTIGASATIPDSSVKQWTEPLTLSTTDADGNTISETVDVRRYSEDRNKMFRFARHHGQSAAGTGRSGYMRIGPLALRCMNCHQPHNATNMVWRPTALETGTQLASGYKLLRLMPSASIQGTATISGSLIDYDAGMQSYKAYTEFGDAALGEVYVNTGNAVKVPETTMTASNTGPGKTIYTTFEGVTNPAHQHGPDRDPQTVNQYALSPWCADCHNLNIGYWKHLATEELGFKSHSDRTHPAPYTGAYNGPAQCYSCHRNDLPIQPATSYYDGSASRTACERCHFGTGSYKAVSDNIDGAGTKSDFPHSGQGNTIKLLGQWQTQADPAKTSNIWMDTTGTAANVTKDNLDSVCLRCHVGIGTNH